MAMDIEKAIDFLLQQQAKFWAALEADRADQIQFRQKTSEEFAEIRDILRQVVTVQGTLVQTGLKHEESLRRSDERWDRLVDAQRRADERMDALIAIVNGLVRREQQQGPNG